MKEIVEILERVSSLGENEHAILATVVELRGSGYRLPGARMLISQSDGTIGTVSGGCLEADVLERAKRVKRTGRAEVFTYDTTANEDSVFSLNMGCRGIIRILLEPVRKDSALLRALSASVDERRRHAVATLVTCPDQSIENIGGRLIFDGMDEIYADGLPSSLADLGEICAAVKEFSSSGRDNDIRTFERREGEYEFAFEQILPPVSLLVFGAGADAVPMAKIASEIGWQVAVRDHRPAFLTQRRFPTARSIMHEAANGPVTDLGVDSRTAAVVMTHNYGRDLAILPALLRSNVFYIGILGPKRRTEQLLDELVNGGENFSRDQLARVYAPVGLDIGGTTPESIALAIAAEIQSVLRSRRGGPLRERDAPIYDHR